MHTTKFYPAMIEGYGHKIMEGVNASFVHMNDSYGVCAIRVLMNKRQFSKVESMAKEMMTEFKLAEPDIYFDARGFGVLSFAGYKANMHDNVVSELKQVVNKVSGKVLGSNITNILREDSRRI